MSKKEKGVIMRKKIFCLYFTLFFICVSSLFSQDWFVGGNVFFIFGAGGNTTYNNYDTDIRLSPVIGYKFNKFDFGLNPIFQYTLKERETYYYTNKDESIGYGLGIFTRYNFITFGKLSLLGRLGVDYVYLTTTGEDFEAKYFYEEIRHNVNVSLSPVIEYRLLDRLTIFSGFGSIASLTYNNYKREFDNDKRSDNSLDFSLLQNLRINLTSITIGFYYLF